ncbi:hypothetical protein EJB05_37654, partial [Eragrostis curvula]
MSTVPRQDSCDGSDTHDSLESYKSLESYETWDSYRYDDLMEAPTLSSKELKRAREQALKILATETPEEAFKIFTKVSELKIDSQPKEKVETGSKKMPPPKADDGKPGATVQPPPKN